MSKVTSVCLCGGGNGSHVCAGYIGSKAGYEVHVLTRRPQEWIEGMKENGGVLCHARKNGSDDVQKLVGKVHPTSNAADVKDCDIFILGGPAHANPEYLAKIAPYVKKGAYIGALYTQGGFNWAVKDAIGADKIKELDITIFGLLHIPWICKMTSYGKECRIIGPKKYLQAAVEPRERFPTIAALIENLFDIPCKQIPNFLSLTLTPSNQIIHPGRYYGIFHDWDGKKDYDIKTIPKLYEGVDDFSAKHLQDLSDELQRVKDAILSKYPNLDLSHVKDLGQRICEQYGDEVKDKSNLTKIFSTNKSYAGLMPPFKVLENGRVIPNTECRFFIEDIPYGLCVLKDIGRLAGIKTPIFDKFIQWHQQFMPNKYIDDNGEFTEHAIKHSGAPSRYGVTSLEGVVEGNL